MQDKPEFTLEKVKAQAQTQMSSVSKDTKGKKVDLSSVTNTGEDSVEAAIAQAVADSSGEDDHDH